MKNKKWMSEAFVVAIQELEEKNLQTKSASGCQKKTKTLCDRSSYVDTNMLYNV